MPTYTVTVFDPDAALSETFVTEQSSKQDAEDVARHIYGPCYGPATTYSVKRN